LVTIKNNGKLTTFFRYLNITVALIHIFIICF